MPPLSKKCLAQMYRCEINYNARSNFSRFDPQKPQAESAGRGGGIIGMAQGVIEQVIKGGVGGTATPGQAQP